MAPKNIRELKTEILIFKTTKDKEYKMDWWEGVLNIIVSLERPSSTSLWKCVLWVLNLKTYRQIWAKKNMQKHALKHKNGDRVCKLGTIFLVEGVTF